MTSARDIVADLAHVVHARRDSRLRRTISQSTSPISVPPTPIPTSSCSGQLIERPRGHRPEQGAVMIRISGALGLDATHLAMAGSAGDRWTRRRLVTQASSTASPTAVYDSITSAAWAAAALVSTTERVALVPRMHSSVVS